MWICDRCGIEHPATPEPPRCVLDRGEVGIEEAGDLGAHTGRWWTHEELISAPHRTLHRDHGRGLHSIKREPNFAIGHWSFIAVTPAGTLLWDPPSWLDTEVLDVVRGLGDVAVIATSHPHMFGAQLGWSRALGGVPVLVNERNREWLPAPDPAFEFWDEHVEPLPGLELVRLGGHMRGSAVARTPDGSILAGDTISGGYAPDWVSFQRNFPKHIPLSGAVVRRIVDRLDDFAYDRLYTLGGDTIDRDAKAVVRRSAETHIRWVNGDFDHLT
ncbi:hydrolase [Amycolatopsis sp. NPDC052450]|uniref:hydrolase n=1 Tax=Amycolatopsis sp. NPDC052450 TaxID=3363937 RepID=UPI0037CB17FA